MNREQIQQGLRAADDVETNGLLDAIEKDPLLAEAVETPFYLNTAQLLFASSKVWEEFEFVATDVEGRKAELTERFVASALRKMSDKYAPEDSKKYLGFLADRMERFGLVEFELVDLQGKWTSWKFYDFLPFTLVFCLIFSLSLSLILDEEFFNELFWVGIGWGLIIGKEIGGRNSQWKYREIKTLDYNFISIDKVLKGAKRNFLTGLSLGLIISSIFCVFAWVNGDFYFGLLSVLIIAPFVLVFVFVLGFVAFMFQGETGSFLIIRKPYKRFFNSMKQMHFSIIKHLLLRCRLYKKGLMPFSLVIFLNLHTQYSIFESSGGSWRFRHRILQDYFRAHWQQYYAVQYPTEAERLA
ncbi:MAG: hypothetical protein AAF433_11075 [Bacteroidota bacterium]